jgi:hypothetical protein
LSVTLFALSLTAMLFIVMTALVNVKTAITQLP